MSAADFAAYAARADRWRLLDNGGPRPLGVAEGAGSRAKFVDEERLAALPADLARVRGWRPSP
jgi:hypothetical protein